MTAHHAADEEAHESQPRRGSRDRKKKPPNPAKPFSPVVVKSSPLPPASDEPTAYHMIAAMQASKMFLTRMFFVFFLLTLPTSSMAKPACARFWGWWGARRRCPWRTRAADLHPEDEDAAEDEPEGVDVARVDELAVLRRGAFWFCGRARGFVVARAIF